MYNVISGRPPKGMHAYLSTLEAIISNESEPARKNAVGVELVLILVPLLVLLRTTSSEEDHT